MSDRIGIIPARFSSTRFPGKPLAMIGNKPMVCHVYDRASEALPGKIRVIVTRSISQSVDSKKPADYSPKYNPTDD